MKSIVRSLFSIMAVRNDDEALLKAQYRAFSRQIPMMYFLLMTSTWALAATHMAFAPWWLTIAVPAAFTAFVALRVAFWLHSRHVEPSAHEALVALNRTNRLATIIAVAFTGWAFALYPYGDGYTRSHIAFYMAITVIACIFSLMYLRSAALRVTLVVNGTFAVFFVSTTQPTFMAMAVNILLVSVGMLAILQINYRNFVRLVEGQQRTEALSNENLRLANLDSLTDLPNRRAFFARLETEYASAQAHGTRLAVGIVDLDGFKPVNDFHGHSTGDRLLVQVAARLARFAATDEMFLARLGGDEFAFMVSAAADDEALVAIGEGMAAALRAPFQLAEATVQISGTIGIAVYPDIAASTEELFDRADYALYHAKRAMRGGVTLFDTTHIAEILRDTRIEQMLRQADFDAELFVFFQPIVDVRDGQVVALEALARWNSPVLGDVSPAYFIPVAERSGLIGQITRHLLRKALAAAQQWPDHLRLSFNLSAHDLNTQEGALAIVGIVEGSRFDARRLDLEITETAFMHDFPQVQRSIEFLKMTGCGICLDDFGTGYSSLTHLHALPLTKIKIDRRFVAHIHENPASYKIVKSLLALSRDMNIECVIEGVETTEELSTVKQLGGIHVQGYLYARPMRAEEVVPFVDASRRAHAHDTA